MAQRYIHYEAAFEDYLRSRGWPYVPVDEQRKAIFAGARVKSFDFIVYPATRPAWLVDVKGRQFPYVGANGTRYWENWVTREDVAGLRQWESVFGDSFVPVFVFAYWLTRGVEPPAAADVHWFRERCYAFGWVGANDYAAAARRRSPKWDTIDVPARTFRRLIRPLAGA